MTGQNTKLCSKCLQGEELLFRVKAEGREYRIYTSGRIEGFGSDARIFNCYPLLLAVNIRRHLDARPTESPRTSPEVNTPAPQTS